MKFLKENWFKISIIIFLAMVFLMVYNFFSFNQKTLISQKQQECSVFGVKLDKEYSDKYTNNPLSQPEFTNEYHYNTQLNTCLRYYNYSYNVDKKTGVPSDVGWSIDDVYATSKTILNCDDNTDNSGGYPQYIYTITENMDGISISSSGNKITKYDPKDELVGQKACELIINNLMQEKIF